VADRGARSHLSGHVGQAEPRPLRPRSGHAMPARPARLAGRRRSPATGKGRGAGEKGRRLTLRMAAGPAEAGKTEDGESAAASSGHLRGNSDGRRRFRPPRVDSFDVEEEGGTAELRVCSSTRGEAASSGARRRPWRRSRARVREGRGEGVSQGEGRKAGASGRLQVASLSTDGKQEVAGRSAREPPRSWFLSQRRRQGRLCRKVLSFANFLKVLKTTPFSPFDDSNLF
jgi:hypothetical protein